MESIKLNAATLAEALEKLAARIRSFKDCPEEYVKQEWKHQVAIPLQQLEDYAYTISSSIEREKMKVFLDDLRKFPIIPLVDVAKILRG